MKRVVTVFVVVLMSFNDPASRISYSFDGFTIANWLNPCEPNGMCESVALSVQKVAAEWDEQAQEGWVDFGSGRVTLAAGDGVLLMGLVADDAEARDRLEGVVGRHLVKFGAKDELVCAWARTDGTPGSEHRHEGE